MATPKDILVTTTSSLGDVKIKQYLKPVSAHVVAGTNLFSDFFASFSDVFGGRSGTYQRQLRSLYNEATERIRQAAYEIGANAILGLSIDMDEISGKNKSMFMLTAIGTAVIIDKEVIVKGILSDQIEKVENVPVERVKSLQKKQEIIENANENKLVLDENIWSFITSNQIREIFPYLIAKYKEAFIQKMSASETFKKFDRAFVQYIDALPENIKKELLYGYIIEESNDAFVFHLCEVIEELDLLDFHHVKLILEQDNFSKSKLGIRLLTSNKPFFNRSDVDDYVSLVELINKKFVERGQRGSKKGLLSSKEKEIWNCECGKVNIPIGENCMGCMRDISGFLRDEIKPTQITALVNQKIEFIKECVK